ncbi:MAG: DMT family transporter [Deltaproteobacteria bacterium]|nr:DMT family transporter [Deltaproteobacteria bacterium]
MSRSAWLSYMALLSAMILWAGSFVALKIAFRSYDPIVVIFGRMAIAVVCFSFFARKLRPVHYEKGQLRLILFMALCEPCLYFLFEAKALEYTAASQASIIAAMLPLLVAVAAHFFLKERLGRRNITGFVIAILGSCWLSLTAEISESAPHPVLGNFLEFMAMVCATGYIVTLKRLTATLSPFFLTAVQTLAGCLFYLPLLFLPSTTLPSQVAPTALLAMVYLGAFVTFGAYALYNFGVSRVPASQASAFVNLIPAFTILFSWLSWLILDEKLTFQQYLAMLLIFLGVFLSQDQSAAGT